MITKLTQKDSQGIRIYPQEFYVDSDCEYRVKYVDYGLLLGEFSKQKAGTMRGTEIIECIENKSAFFLEVMPW